MRNALYDHFVFGKLREGGTSETEVIKQLRIAIANFKSKVEEILREQKRINHGSGQDRRINQQI